MCDTIVAVTGEGILFAKNSDRDPNEGQTLEWWPARDWPPGARLRCTWIEIPQAPRTHAVLLSRPFWMWGAEIGANEHGVVIGNEAVFTDQPYGASGLTGMDLLRLALERSTRAEEAVATIVTLLEAHGQGGGCGHEDRAFTYHNSFLVADPGEAFVLETAGRHHAVERVRARARSISNGLSIPAFARAHPERLKTWVSRCALRRARTEALASDATGPADLARLLRDHGEGRSAPAYAALNGGMDAPCMHAGGLATGSQTTASWVADLRGGRPRHWVTATAAPCTGLFKPVRVEEPVELGPGPGERANDGSLFWRHERLHRRVLRDPARLLPLFAAERDEVEARWLADPPSSAAAFAEGDRLLAAWTDRVRAAVGPDRRPWFVRRYWARRDRRAGPLEPTAGSA